MSAATRYVHNKLCVRVKDLADQWHTTTSAILATGKPQHVPPEYLHHMDNALWCDLDGLAARVDNASKTSNITLHLARYLHENDAYQSVVRRRKHEQARKPKGGKQSRMITVWENSSIVAECVNPEPQDIRHAMDNRLVLWRYKNDRIQVLAQTLSSFLDTRTSSLLAVNKKQGVPGKYIHRAWKRTWVDLEGLKVRVQHTEHGSALLKGLKQVIEILDAYKTAYTRPPMVSAEQQAKSASASASKPSASAASERKRNASSATKPEQKPSAPLGSRRNPIDPCDVAVEANKRAVHNTGRLKKLTRDEAALENLIFKYRDACSIDLYTQSKRLDMFADRTHDLDKRVKALEHDVPQLLNQTGHDSDLSKARTSQLTGRVHNLEDRVAVIEAWDKQPKHNTERLNELGCRVHELEGLMYKGIGPDGIDPDFLMKNQLDSIRGRLDRIEAGDKQAVQAMAEGKTPLDALSQRVSSMVTHTDRLDAKTDGLESRVSVLEDTSKWLSWTLAGVIGVRFLGLMLRLLRRK